MNAFKLPPDLDGLCPLRLQVSDPRGLRRARLAPEDQGMRKQHPSAPVLRLARPLQEGDLVHHEGRERRVLKVKARPDGTFVHVLS